jgi:hypothetical protein
LCGHRKTALLYFGFSSSYSSYSGWDLSLRNIAHHCTSAQTDYGFQLFRVEMFLLLPKLPQQQIPYVWSSLKDAILSNCSLLIAGTLTFETDGEIIYWITPVSREFALFLALRIYLTVDCARLHPWEAPHDDTRGSI